MPDQAQEARSAATPSPRGNDKTPWPAELMHAELCAWRFGGKCDCGKESGSHPQEDV